MQFTTLLALTATIVGVSANVHSECYCANPNDELDIEATQRACASYPRDRLFNSDEKLIDPATVLLEVDLGSGLCVSKDTATGQVAAHIGGNEMQASCVNAEVGGQSLSSICP